MFRRHAPDDQTRAIVKPVLLYCRRPSRRPSHGENWVVTHNERWRNKTLTKAIEVHIMFRTDQLFHISTCVYPQFLLINIQCDFVCVETLLTESTLLPFQLARVSRIRLTAGKTGIVLLFDMLVIFLVKRRKTSTSDARARSCLQMLIFLCSLSCKRKKWLCWSLLNFPHEL